MSNNHNAWTILQDYIISVLILHLLFLYFQIAEQIKLRPSYEDIVCQKYRFKLEVLASSIFIKNFNRDLFKFVI